MKIAIVSFKSILDHPTHVLSADYWVNIQEGKLPFNKGDNGRYSSISHTKDLNTATWLFLHEARELNIAIGQVKKAEAMLSKVKAKLNLEDKKADKKAKKGAYGYIPEGLL